MDDLPKLALSPGWMNFFIVVGVLALVSLIALVLSLIFGKRPKRKRRRLHRHHRRSPNPTLAETGGLPPPRNENPPQP